MSISDFVVAPVKWFDSVKGYGFALHENDDIFIHTKRLKESGFTTPLDPNESIIVTGEKLKFRIANGPKGLYAIEISKV